MNNHILTTVIVVSSLTIGSSPVWAQCFPASSGSGSESRLISFCDPEDPSTGNPVSLQSIMARDTFASGTDVGPSALTGGSRARATLANNHLGLGFKTGHYKGPGYSASIQALPIDYTIPFGDPRWALKLGLPLTYVDINGSQTFSGSFSVGVRTPVFDYWTITPEVRVGMVRNRVFDQTVMLLNTSITSNFQIPLQNDYVLVFGNAITHSRSLGTASGGANRQLRNMIYQNGAEISGPLQTKLYGLPTNWQFSVVYTNISGDETFVDELLDISFSLGTTGSKNGVTWDSVRIGLTYTHANNGIDGFNLNFGYEF
jgi:hypothetical protein